MSKRDFDEYYNSIFEQYKSLQGSLEEMSKEVSNGMVEPERLDNLRATVAPVVTSYQTLSYIKYLLDKPNKCTKRARYDKQSVLLKKSEENNGKKILNRNSDIIRDIKL